MQKRVPLYDKSQDGHYNLISALHKTVRGSDPDAALYYLARMLAAGENPLYIARRMVRMAIEDIGLADPQALVQALAAKDTFDFLGSPEGELALAQATIYLATAPKSNSVVTAISRAMEDAPGTEPVPLHLRDASYKGAKQLGHGKGYRYPHDFPGHAVDQEYRPAGFSGRRYYEPSGQGRDTPRKPGSGERTDDTPA